MACPELVDTRTAAARLGVSVSYLVKLRLFRPADSPPFVRMPGGRRVAYRITGDNSLDSWVAARTSGATGVANGK
jgi:hypothetical protein